MIASNLRAAFTAVLTLSALSACVSVQSTRLGAGLIHLPLPADNVAIYTTAQQVGGQYEEVALLSVSGDYSRTHEEQIYKRMRETAGSMGANAIVLDAMSPSVTGAKIPCYLLGTPPERLGKSVAIYIATSNTVASK